MNRVLPRSVLFILLLLAALPAFASDGQVLINESTVSAAGGYPYRITQPGSYKLSGNLSALANHSAILITTGNVTIDLNGFSISCSEQPPAPTGFNFACITDNDQPLSNLTIRNGSIMLTATVPYVLGKQFSGIYIQASHGTTLEDLHIEGSTIGIQVNAYVSGVSSIIRHNTLTGVAGPSTSCPSVVEGNVNATNGAGNNGSHCVFVNNAGLF